MSNEKQEQLMCNLKSRKVFLLCLLVDFLLTKVARGGTRVNRVMTIQSCLAARLSQQKTYWRLAAQVMLKMGKDAEQFIGGKYSTLF